MMSKMKKIVIILIGIISALSCVQSNDSKMDMNNEVIEAMKSRRAIRKYKPEIVDSKVLEKIIECGVNAPSALNKQSWEIRVVNNPEILEKIKDALVASNPESNPEEVRDCFRQARTVLFIANDTTFPFSPVDCGLMAENMILSAWSMGIGSCCLGGPARFMTSNAEAAKYLKEMGFSENYELLLCIGFGYPAETPKAKPRNTEKVKFMD